MDEAFSGSESAIRHGAISSMKRSKSKTAPKLSGAGFLELLEVTILAKEQNEQ